MGKQENQFAWFLFCNILSFALTIAVLVSCSNGSTNGQYLIQTSLSDLLADLVSSAYSSKYASAYNISGLSADAVEPVNLPWGYWVGVSGVCRSNSSTGRQICNHHFPQTVDILSLVSKDIGSADTDTNAQYASWSSLVSVGGSALETNRSLMKSLAQASSALLILSVIISLYILLNIFYWLAYIIHFKKPIYDLWKRGAVNSYVGVEYFNALITLGPVVMWTYTWWNVVNDLNGINIGPGFVMLWVALVVRILTHVTVLKHCKEKCGRRRQPGQMERRAMRCLNDCEDIICFGSVRFVNDGLEC